MRKLERMKHQKPLKQLSRPLNQLPPLKKKMRIKMFLNAFIYVRIKDTI